MKKLLSLFLAIMAIMLALTSCGEEAPSYETDVKVYALAVEADKAISSQDLLETDADYIKGMMGADAAKDFAEYCVKIQSTGASLDEYGIFKANSEADVANVEKIVDSYFQKRKDAWMNEYLVEEYPKLENASRKTFGLYVVYGILSDSDKTALFNAVENMLIQKKK